MACAEANKHGCHQDRCKVGANKMSKSFYNFTKRRSLPKSKVYVYLAAYEKIGVIVKTEITKTDGGVGITTKDGVLCPYN